MNVLIGPYSDWIDDGGANAATGGRNEVSAKNLEGLSAKLAVTYTLGRNN